MESRYTITPGGGIQAATRFALIALLTPSFVLAQDRQVSNAMRRFVSVDAQVVALTHVRVVDGTGGQVRNDQTIVIDGERIVAVGNASDVRVPPGARELDLTGHTVIPGIIGLHDHMYYSMKQMPVSYPRLFLGNGVTTIRTTGSINTYTELNLKRSIDMGQIAGPEIHATGPYLQGGGTGPGLMYSVSGPEDARRVVRYWAEEGVGWFKAYTTISRAELGAAIDEAHKQGIKVTAHLCSVTYREAVALGIDNLEHGLTANTDYMDGKQLDQCPSVSTRAVYADQRNYELLIEAGFAPETAVQIMTLNGAKVLGIDDRVGSIVPGMQADMVVLNGDPTTDAGAIKNVVTVFRLGLGFDAAKLIESTKGQVGLQ